jgi:16S rRNA (cytosine1402-N4)-methyltransferase
MRFGPMGEITAERIINTYRENQLVEIFKEYGEERLARPIAKKIIEIRKQQPIQTPQQLLTIAAEVYQKFYRNKSKINPATKIFQALRIAVNDELTNLKEVLPQAASLLKKGGRLVVISYHSLEDRIVKDFFRNENRSCICPPQLPTCQCNHKKTLKIITKKPIEPTGKEILENPRSRSAKLRVAEKI